MSTVAEIAWSPPDSNSELRSFFEHAPLPLARCERQGRIFDCNLEFEKMVHRGPNAAGGLYFADLMYPRQRAEGERLFRELFERRVETFSIDSEISEPTSRRVRWIVWRAAEHTPEPPHAVVLALPAAENEESDERLRQAQRLETVGRLAGGVAHDFNNLLTGVLLYCDLLLAYLEPNHRVRKYAEEIKQAGMQATGLVRQLLTVTRARRGEPRLVLLNDIAEGMRNLLRRLIGENLNIEFHLDPELGLIRMDPTQAQQILLNLALNARDAMPGGGLIRVETRNCRIQVLGDAGVHAGAPAALPCALFVVSDTGMGMDAETRARLFEPFFTTKSSKGTGLGLATVHDIVSSNGGLIYIDSSPGCGTRVSVLLPIANEGSEPGAPDSIAAKTPELQISNENKNED